MNNTGTYPKLDHCILCSSKKLERLSDYPKTFLVQCEECAFVFSEKIPTQKELEEHYTATYNRNDYLSPITIKRYNELLDEFEKYKSTGRLLDTGSGIGLFAEVAIKRGWQVYGNEFTETAIKICESKGVVMKSGALHAEMFPADFFDVVTSFEVIEHINNPNEEAAYIRKFLRPGGLLYLTTPNFNSLLRYCLKEQYNIFVWPEHLSYYTPATILKLFSRHGFRTSKILTTGFSITRLKTSTNIQEDTKVYITETTDDEKLRGAFESKAYMRWIKNSVNTFLSAIGKGDSLKAYLEKV